MAAGSCARVVYGGGGGEKARGRGVDGASFKDFESQSAQTGHFPVTSASVGVGEPRYGTPPSNKAHESGSPSQRPRASETQITWRGSALLWEENNKNACTAGCRKCDQLIQRGESLAPADRVLSRRWNASAPFHSLAKGRRGRARKRSADASDSPL